MPKPKRTLKKIPEFATEAAERRFWETHDSTDYVDWSQAQFVRFANLKPSTETISLRLPSPLLSDLKALANKRDVPYQSLLKVFVAERVAAEWRATAVLGDAAPAKKRAQTAKARQAAVAKRRAGRRLRD